MENGMMADIAAVTRPNFMGGYGGCGMGGFGGFGGDWILGLIAIAAVFGGGFGGFGGFGGGGRGVGLELQAGFDTQNILSKLNGITNGISDATYALNNSINGINMNLSNALCSTTYELASKIDNNRFAAQQCCCETQRAIDGVNYNNAKNTCDIVNAIHAEGNATRDLITQNEMKAMQNKITELTATVQAKDLAISQANQNAYLLKNLDPKAVPAYIVQNPNCCQNPCGGCNGYNQFA